MRPEWLVRIGVTVGLVEEGALVGDLNPQERQASTGQWKQSVAEH